MTAGRPCDADAVKHKLLLRYAEGTISLSCYERGLARLRHGARQFEEGESQK